MSGVDDSIESWIILNSLSPGRLEWNILCRKVSNIRRTLVGNKIVDHSDVVEQRLSALLQLHRHSQLNTWLQYIVQRQLQAEKRNIQVLAFGASYIRDFTVSTFQTMVSLGK